MRAPSTKHVSSSLYLECGSFASLFSYFYYCKVFNFLSWLVFLLCGYNVNSIIPFCLGEQVVELDLKTVVPCCSGPKRPQDKVAVSDMKKDFETCLGAKVGPSKFCLVPCFSVSRLSPHWMMNLFKPKAEDVSSPS